MKKTSLTRKLFAPALLAAAIAPLALSASAAPGGTGEPHGEAGPFHAEQREALFERAGIDEETRAALDEAQQAHRQALEELREEHRARLDEILDDEQRVALEQAKRELRAEHRAERRQAMQERLATLIDGWGLDAETRQSLDELRRSFDADRQALHEREFDSRDERHQAWQALREEHRAALAELLSEQQLTDLEQAMRPPHDGRGHHRGPGRHGEPGPHGGPEQAPPAAE